MLQAKVDDKLTFSLVDREELNRVLAAKTPVVDCYLHTLSRGAVSAELHSHGSQINREEVDLPDHNNFQTSRCNGGAAAPRRVTLNKVTTPMQVVRKQPSPPKVKKEVPIKVTA